MFTRDLQDFVFKSVVFTHFVTFIFSLFYPLGIYWGFQYWDILGFRFYHIYSRVLIFLESTYFKIKWLMPMAILGTIR